MEVKDVKAMARLAIACVMELFGEQSPLDVGLEEVRFDDASNEWEITVGFNRAAGALPVPAYLNQPQTPRLYKVVRLTRDGAFVSVSNAAS